jgi:hypothetical protein
MSSSSVSAVETNPVTGNNAFVFANSEHETPRERSISYAPKQSGSWGVKLDNLIQKANAYNVATDQIGLQNAKYNVFEVDPFRNPQTTNIEAFKMQVPVWPPRTMVSQFPDTENSIQYLQPNRSGWTPQEYNQLNIPVFQPNPNDAKKIPGVPILTSKTGPGVMSAFSSSEVLRLAEKRQRKAKQQHLIAMAPAPAAVAPEEEPSSCVTKLLENMATAGQNIASDVQNWNSLKQEDPLDKIRYVLTTDNRFYYISTFLLFTFLIFSGLIKLF